MPKRILQGVVVSDKNEKTIVVLVERRLRHPVLKKTVRLSKKPAEVRMGSGKGSTEYWAARVKPGRVIFEIDGIPRSVAEESLRLAAAKLPIKTRFVARLGEA